MAPRDDVMQLVDALPDAVVAAAAYTVRVNGRGDYGSTGVAWSPGIIVTADHTLERDEDITLGLPDGTEVQGIIVGRDPASDLAVLRAECELIPGTREGKVRVGTLVVAIGRGTGRDVAASLGIISAIGGSGRSRTRARLGDLIRPDLTMYPGFSGGPLVTVTGALIGVNTSRLGGGALTIPVEIIDRVVEQILAHGRIKRRYLGLTSQPVRLAEGQASLAGQETGLVVISVEPESPAIASDVIVGDVLLELGGHRVRDTDDLRAALVAATPGQPVALHVIRGDEIVVLSVTIGER